MKNKLLNLLSIAALLLFLSGCSEEELTPDNPIKLKAANEFWLEAECGAVGASWNVLQSATASSGNYVTIQSGNNSLGVAPGNNMGYITFNFDLLSSGNYTFWARVRAPSPDDDSFWVRMDNGSWYNWNNITASSEWVWDDCQTYNLSAGNHTLTIAYREDGTHLDKIYIGNTTPSGYGSAASNCGSGTGGVFIPDGTYTITSTLSNKVIEVAGSATSNGANIQQWGYNGSAGQNWVLVNRGDNWYSLSPSNATNRAIDIENISSDNGANALLWDYWGSDNQLFKFVNASNGYNIVAKHSGKCLDVYNFSTSDGGNIAQWTVGANQSNQIFTLEPASNNNAIVIDGNTNYQIIDGFGFSSAWCGTLTTAKNDALYNTLGFSLLRVRFDQNNNWNDERNNAAAAHARGAKVLGCPWKIPDAYRSGNTIPPSQYGNYTSWIRDAANYINVDYVSLKNEPDGSLEDGNINGEQFREICRDHVQKIDKPIVIADAINFNDSYTDPTLNDPVAVNNISYVAGHLYGGGLRVHQNAINKGKRVWMTEYYVNGINDIDACMTIAKQINDCMYNQFSAYIWWWVNDNDLNVNLVNNSGVINKNGYTMGQFAKWIRPGKQRIGCPYNPVPNVYITAYRGGGVVVVAVNTGSSPITQTFLFSNISGLNTINVTRTSASENMSSVGSVSLANNAFTYTLPAKSVTTFHQY